MFFGGDFCLYFYHNLLRLNIAKLTGVSSLNFATLEQREKYLFLFLLCYLNDRLLSVNFIKKCQCHYTLGLYIEKKSFILPKILILKFY